MINGKATLVASYYTGDPNNDFPVLPGANGYPQGIGHFSTTFPSSVNYIEFVDWPPKIGVKNIDPTTVPEPGTLSLVGVVLAGFGFARTAIARRRQISG